MLFVAAMFLSRMCSVFVKMLPCSVHHFTLWPLYRYAHHSFVMPYDIIQYVFKFIYACDIFQGRVFKDVTLPNMPVCYIFLHILYIL